MSAFLILTTKSAAASPAVYFPALIAHAGVGAFAAQCIPTAPELLEVSRYKEFLVERRKLISKRLNEYLNSAGQG